MEVMVIKFDSEKRIIYHLQKDFGDFVALNNQYMASIALRLGYNNINDLFEAIDRMYGIQTAKIKFELRTLSAISYLS